MPRRSAGRSPAPRAPLRSSVPARPPPAAPAPVQQQQPMMMQQPKQPGLFAQMASTAAGVAVGSTVGHVASAAILGGGSNNHQEAAPAPAPAAPPAAYGQQPQYVQYQQQPEGGVCSMEMKQFLDCAQTQHDITLCQGFNEALRQCKMANGLQV